MQRVGSKGPAADLTRVLVARLTPSLLPPEVLHACMDAAEGSQEAQRLLVDVAGAAPHLLAQVGFLSVGSPASDYLFLSPAKILPAGTPPCASLAALSF